MKTYLLPFLQIIICLCTEVFVADDMCLSPMCACCKSGECIVAGGNTCDGCRDGLTTETCRERCPDKCFNCSQTFFSFDRTCYACKPGYYNGRWEDNMELPLLKDCSLKCQSGCEICESHNNCIRCNISHFMSSRLICEQCQENCEICSSATDCMKCKDEYFKGWDGGCKPCIPHCKTCSSNVDCQECKQGFYLDKNECQICQEGCMSCNDTRTCNKCETGYHQFDSKCFHFPEVSCADNENGIVCKETCLNRCLNRVCNDSTGSCTVGCLSGYWGGKSCKQTCVTYCKDTVCNFSDGKCEAQFKTQARHFGLVVGLAIGGVFAIVAVFTCYFKRQHLSRRFEWMHALDDCCRCLHKDKEMEEANTLNTSSESTKAVNSWDKNETESLLTAGNSRNEKNGDESSTEGTLCNNSDVDFESSKDGVATQTPKMKQINEITETRRKYIVSYGPNETLLDESFWKKVWQSQCETVVMLSPSQESEDFNVNLNFKSDGYCITVVFAEGRNLVNYTMRPVNIMKDTEEVNEDVRKVVLLEFFAWPKVDIGDNVESFLEFHQIVKSYETKLNGPTLVHCSAGVDRCRTYIAVDMLQKNANKKDIRQCLQHMKFQSTQEQVDIIYRILAKWHLSVPLK